MKRSHKVTESNKNPKRKLTGEAAIMLSCKRRIQWRRRKTKKILPRNSMERSGKGKKNPRNGNGILIFQFQSSVMIGSVEEGMKSDPIRVR